MIKSIDLLEKDSVLMYNDSVVNVIRKEVEEFAEEETTYNFEVEGYHTYYVGENSILVHNNCRRKAVRDAWKQEQKNALEGKKLSRDWNAKELQQLKRTGRVRGYEGHHINSVNGHEIMAGDPIILCLLQEKNT